jgi:hypothetical protein
VRTALDRLEGAGIIRPCDPAVVAAKIKCADQRPQGWDLGMHLVRDDLNDEDLTALGRQVPGLRARFAAMRGADGLLSDRAGGEVQQLHPAAGPVDKRLGGVRWLRPAPPMGCNHRGSRVQPLPEPGTGCSGCTRTIQGTARRLRSRARPRSRNGWPAGDGRRQCGVLQPAGAELAADGLAAASPGANGGGRAGGRVGSGGAGSIRRCEYGRSAQPGRGANHAAIHGRIARSAGEALGPVLPPWCGAADCDERTRRLQLADGADGGRCPRSHPLATCAVSVAPPGLDFRSGGKLEMAVLDRQRLRL